MQCNIRKINAGFSLIEVAIAVLVISLVATFSLKGRDLIQTARLRAVMEQADTFRLAVQTFMEKYNAIPGDLTDASELIDSSLTNGDGSGNISTLSDAKRFWSHLSKAGLLNNELINGLPTSKIGGYFSVSSTLNGKPGIWLILSKGTTDNSSFRGLLTPDQAYYIDKNSDDGSPNSGNVQAIKGSDASEECINGESYNFKSKSENCVILFKIY